MSLANGREYLAIPGPSAMPDRVLRAMHRASPNIYEGELIEMTDGIKHDLAKLAGTAGDVAIYIGNGHAAWEAALSNTLSRGDHVLVLNTGSFVEGWGEIARGLGAVVQMLDFGRRSTIDLDLVETALRADTDHKIKAVLAVQVDTASSVLNDLSVLRPLLDRLGHPALLMGDCMASFGCEAFEMDKLGIDVTIAGSQKGLMTPAGVALLWVNERAQAVRKHANGTTAYWDWAPRISPEYFAQNWCGTAPTHHLFGLREALDMIAEEGREAVWARHRHLAEAVWAACETWATVGPLELNIADPKLRSHAVTSIRMGAPDGTRLRQWVEANTGVTLGIGLGMASDDDPHSDGFFRIGHMGHVNAHMVLGVLGAIEAGMTALKIPHGSGGMTAAVEVISRA